MTGDPPIRPRPRLLDCTLRDGGYVNQFRFGADSIRAIVSGLSAAGADLIELGFLKDGRHEPGQTLYTTVAEAAACLEGVPATQGCTLMIRPDWYDIRQLEPCDGRIGTLRFAFHEEDLPLALHQAEVARSLGYRVVFNPVNVNSYAPPALRAVLRTVNRAAPDAVCIVDTFGSLFPDELEDKLAVFDGELAPEVALGIHLHENLSLSLALAHLFLARVGGTRRTIIDASVLGMGRIPGNLCTELVMHYLNARHGGSYRLEPVYALIDHPVGAIRRAVPWGYLPAYAITAVRKMHRSYAEHLMAKPDLTLVDIDVILHRVTEPADLATFNEALVEALYEEHRRAGGRAAP